MRHRLAISLLLAALGAPSVARAQQPPAELVGREAEQRYAEGRKLFAEGRYEEARLKFVEACAAHRTINCPRNLAAAEFELGHFADAATHLREYFHSPDVPKDDPSVAKLRQTYEQALAKCGHVTVDAPLGADVQLDGVPVGRAPLADPIDAMPGEHTLAMSLGGNVQTTKVVLVAGQDSHVSLAESPAAPPSPAIAPPPSPPPAPSAPPSAQPEAPHDTQTASSWWTGRRVAGTVVVGAGVLALAGGFVFAGLASSKGSDATTLQSGIPLGGCPSNPSCGALNEAFNDQHTDHVASVALLVAGGAFFVVGAALILWPTSKASSSVGASWIQPYVLAHEGGLQLRGDF